MKLELVKGWFEKNIPHDNPEVGAGLPEPGVELPCATGEGGIHRDDDFVEAYAFGALVQLLRRDRKLTVDQLASAVQVGTPELISIELDPKYIPKPRTVFQISKYFGLPDRPLMKLANVTTTHNDQLRDAAVRFAASSSKVMELSREERAALAEFVQFLASQEDD
jgi:transcriptional regulator with XRE-family HTH domain